MNLSMWQLVPILISLAALVVTLMTYQRAGKWKQSEEGRALVDKVNEHEGRLTVVETKQLNLATKADIAKLDAEFGGLQDVVKSEVAGIRGAVDDMKEGVGEIRRWIMQEGKS